MKAMLFISMVLLLATSPSWHTAPAPATSKAPTAPLPGAIPLQWVSRVEANGFASLTHAQGFSLGAFAIDRSPLRRRHLRDAMDGASVGGYRHWLHGNVVDREFRLDQWALRPQQMQMERGTEAPSYQDRVFAHLHASLTLVPHSASTTEYTEHVGAIGGSDTQLATTAVAEPQAVESEPTPNCMVGQEQ